jgi:hypothetical protein
VTRRWGRRRKLLDDLGDRTGYSSLKEAALDRIKWRNRYGRGFGPVVWQVTDEWRPRIHHGLFPACFPTKIMQSFPVSPIHVKNLIHLTVIKTTHVLERR